MSLKEVSGANQIRVIDTIFEGGWSQGRDIGDLDTLITLLKKKSIDAGSFADKISDVCE